MLVKPLHKYITGQALIIFVFLGIAAVQFNSTQQGVAGRSAQSEHKTTVEDVDVQIANIQRESGKTSSSEIVALMATREAINSRDASSVNQKVSHLRNSMQLFAEAISADPNNPKIRVYRLTTIGQIPRFFRDSRLIKADLEFLEKWLDENGKSEGQSKFSDSVCEALLSFESKSSFCLRDREVEKKNVN